ncbi:unnamed protein product [Aphanomyces euteiches]
MVSYADRRRDSARKGMAKLRAARKREMEILMAQEQNLQVALEYLKAHPEEQHQSIQPFAYARRVLDQHHDDALREQVIARNRLIQSERTAKKKRIDDYKAVVLAAQAHILNTECINLELLTRQTGRLQLRDFLQHWLASQSPQKGRPLLMETILLPDDNGRRSGCYFMTNRAYNLSKQKYPPRKTYEEEVEDFLEVKIHLDEDDRGTCVLATECHIQFTVDANFENVAKTWWFDLVESNPLVEASIIEKFEDRIKYVKHEYTKVKYRRLCVAGVFLDQDQDRIMITQTGIAIDEHFPFVHGESRSNGIQWIVFQHVTDRLTIVRWSIVSFCPVSAKGPLSFFETALNAGCDVKPEDCEERAHEINSLVDAAGLNWSQRRYLLVIYPLQTLTMMLLDDKAQTAFISVIGTLHVGGKVSIYVNLWLNPPSKSNDHESQLEEEG